MAIRPRSGLAAPTGNRMVDDNNPRSYRSSEPSSRASFKGGSGNDPLAELARLIGQTDPFAEFGRQQQPATPAAATQSAEQPWPAHGYAAASETFRDQYDNANHDVAEPGGSGYDTDAYYQDDAAGRVEDAYDDVPPRGRHAGVIVIAAVLALGVVGTAGAFGYRALFGTTGSLPPPVIKADTAPTKVVPPSKSEPQSNKLIYDRVGDRGSNEKVISREEQPIDLAKTQPIAPSAVGAASGSQPANVLADASVPASQDQPKKVHTIAIRPDGQPQAADPAPPPPARVASAPPPPRPTPAPEPRPAPPQRLASAPPIATADVETAMPAARPPGSAPARTAAAMPTRNAPLSLSPDGSAAARQPVRSEPMQTASAPAASARIAPPAATGAAGSYAVQISSQRSEAEAQTAFRSLQGQYPSQLSGRDPIIRRADLGAKGIYYRAMVGPFASSADASGFCQSLKTAGGSCLIQKN